MFLCFQSWLDGGLWGCGFQEITSVNRDDHICNCMSHHCHAYFWTLKLCGGAGINCRAIHFHATALAAAAVAGSTKVVCLFVKKNTHTHTHWKKFPEFNHSYSINKQKQAKTQHHNIIKCYKTEPLFNSQTEEKITVCLSSRLWNLLCRNIHLCSFVSRHGLFNCVNTELQLIDVAPLDRALSPHIIYHVLCIPPLLWNLTYMDRNCTSWQNATMRQ